MSFLLERDAKGAKPSSSILGFGAIRRVTLSFFVRLPWINPLPIRVILVHTTMPPAVVHSDMDDSAEVEGPIFQNTKFFIVQRVPQRQHYISLVETNGGRVVKLEAQADYLIADHLRNDAPAGSLSYKFIEEAINQRAVPQDKTPFLAGRKKSTARPITASTSTFSSSNRSTRIPFSAEDDKILYAWVKKAEDSGLAIKGNQLYNQLAEHNPRHTSQSWRDRYVKYLSERPPAGWEDYLPANLPDLTTAAPRSASIASRPSAAARSPTPSHSKPPTKARVAFSEQDDRELEAWVKQAEGRGVSLLGNKIYQDLEARNPRHTYHSWRDRWIKVLSVQEISEDDEDGVPAPPSPTKPSPTKSRVPFTAEDDEELEAWVRRAMSKGQAVKGQELYKLLEAHNPRHTFKSWRNRWINHLSLRESVEEVDEEDDILSAHSSPVPALSSPAPAPLGKKPVRTSGFRLPPASSVPRAPATNGIFRTSTEQPTPGPSAPKEAATISVPQNTAPQSASVSKNQANTPLARRHNNASTLAPQPASQSATQRLPPSRPTLRNRSTQTYPKDLAPNSSSFTQEDFDTLLECAIDIQNVCVGRYQDSWVAWAESQGRHTAYEWRSFYERRVLPVVLKKEADPDFAKIQGNEWTKFWEDQGQPIDSLPFQTEHSVVEAGDDAPAEIAGIDVEVQVQDKDMEDEELTPKASRLQNPNLPKKAEPSTEQPLEVVKTAQPSPMKRKLQSPDLTEEQDQAQKRHRAESRAAPAMPTLDTVPIQQNDQAKAISISSKAPSSSSYHSDEDYDDINAEEANEQLLREMAETEQSHPPLTKANLARVQSQHISPEGKRGLDLAKDDEDDDQGNFVGYLESLLPEAVRKKAHETVEIGLQQSQDEQPQGLHQDDSQYIDPNLSPVSSEPEDSPLHSFQNRQLDDLDEENDMDTQVRLEIPEVQPWTTSSAPSQQTRSNNRLSTQQIYEAETQPFDSSVPPPPDDADLDISTVAPLTTDSQVLSDEELWPYIEAQESRGFSEARVFEALRMTSFNPQLATRVLDARGGRVNLAGVWSAADDEAVESGNAKAIRELERKHGEGSVMARLKFLAEWREDEERAANGEYDDDEMGG